MSDKILKLDQAQTLYQDLRGRIDALPTSSDIPEVPVQDVQINGTSILNNGVANFPKASSSAFGLVKTGGAIRTGAEVGDASPDVIYIVPSTSTGVKNGVSSTFPLSPSVQHMATFYGLAKAAGDTTQASSNNTVGIYTDSAKAAIQNMLGITDLLSTEESSTATAAHSINSTFMMNGKLHRATAAIAIGDAVVEGTNCEVVKIEDVFIKNTDYASTTTAGVAKIGDGLTMDAGTLKVAGASSATVKTSSNTRYPIVPSRQHESVFYGLSKVAGVDLKNETVTVGTYPETSKTAIRSLIGAAAASDVTVSDVQVNGTSVLSNGVANVPKATNNVLGVISAQSANGVAVASSGALYISSASVDNIKAGTDDRKPITSSNQDASVFYGLAKAAGDTTQSQSDNAVGTYTTNASAAIRSMLGTVGTTDYASTSKAGIVYTDDNSGIGVNPENGYLFMYRAGSDDIKLGTQIYKPIVPQFQHQSVFYGLAKAAGDTTQAQSNNSTGNYTDEAKAAIRNMIGVSSVDDVLIKTPTYGEPTVILDTTTISFQKDGDNDWYCSEKDLFLMTGYYDAIYRIEWDGIEYTEFLCHYGTMTFVSPGTYAEYTAIGRVNFLGNATGYNTSAPFCILIATTTEGIHPQIFTTDTNNSHSIKITEIRYTKNYIPEQLYQNLYENKQILRKGSGNISFVFNYAADATNTGAYAIGVGSLASGFVSAALGYGAIASGSYSMANGTYSTASGSYSMANGRQSIASGQSSYTEGSKTTASGMFSHAEGNNTISSGLMSHSQGYKTEANGFGMHVQGIFNNLAVLYPNWVSNTSYSVGDRVYYSNSQSGFECITANSDSTWTVEHWKNIYFNSNIIDVVGNGTAEDARSNAYALDWEGNGHFMGDVYVGCSTDSSGGNKLISETDYATYTTAGIIIPDISGGIGIDSNTHKLWISRATDSAIKSSNGIYKPIVPAIQHASVFYGLAKAAGADMASSDNPIGTYTDAAKTAIRTMLGAASTNIVAVQDEQPTDTDTKVWLPGTQAAGVQVPTMEDMQNYVQKTDIASANTAGIVKVGNGLGIYNGSIYFNFATESEIKTGTNISKSGAVSQSHTMAFYGLAKAAGVDEKDSTLPLGTYSTTAKTAIRRMIDTLGPSSINAGLTLEADADTGDWILTTNVQDVQINSSSIINNGVANIPIASTSVAGVVKVNSNYGTNIETDGTISVKTAISSEVKSGSNQYKPITPNYQHYSVFYGLAKAAGDITQSASSNAVGTYTAEAKAAIQSMLGVEKSLDLIENISGTTPTIIGQPNVIYKCGEVSILSITPPANGTIDVYFTSGSTATTLTVPNTVKFPGWFDPLALDASTIYEIMITDGIYGSVMAWQS